MKGRKWGAVNSLTVIEEGLVKWMKEKVFLAFQTLAKIINRIKGNKDLSVEIMWWISNVFTKQF